MKLYYYHLMYELCDLMMWLRMGNTTSFQIWYMRAETYRHARDIERFKRDSGL